MRYLLFFLFFFSSMSFSAQVYWGVNGHYAATPQAAAKSLCDANSSICTNFSIQPYQLNPSRLDLLTVIFYRPSPSNPIWLDATMNRYPCGYDGRTTCSNFDYEQNATVCPDGFYSNAGNSIGYVDTCDRPGLKQCSDGTFQLSNGFCPIQVPVCSDYETCYAYAMLQIDCSNATNINFDYTDPENFSYSCDRPDPIDPEQEPDPDWFGCSSETGVCGGINSTGNSSASSSQNSSSKSSVSSGVSSSGSNGGAGSSANSSAGSSSGNTSGGTSSAGSTGSNAGQCDPTSTNYLRCIASGDNSSASPSVSGGDSCEHQPVCLNTDQIQCSQLLQAWHLRCGGDPLASDFFDVGTEGEEDVSFESSLTHFKEELSQLENANVIESFFTFNGSGSCPVWSVQALNFNIVIDQQCSPDIPWDLIRGVIIAVSVLIAARIALH